MAPRSLEHHRPRNHRVRKEVNAVLQSGFLYDGNRIVAQLNGSNAIVSQFIYASGGITPDYMVSGGINYILFLIVEALDW